MNRIRTFGVSLALVVLFLASNALAAAPSRSKSTKRKSSTNRVATKRGSAGDRQTDVGRSPVESPPESRQSPKVLDLKRDLRRVLEKYSHRPLNTRDHTPWEIMHRIVAYGVDAQIGRGGSKGEQVNAIAWLACGAECKGEKLVLVEKDRPVVRKGPRVQGHPGQFLAILAQSRAQRDYGFRVGGKDFSLQDLIQSEQLGCRENTELTFKLIAFMYYLDSEATWKNDAGQDWSIRRLIREEIKAPINGAACGGTHRLMGLSYAWRERERRGEPLDGEFLDAKKHVEKYQQQAWAAQNRDGSLSTEWFKGKGARQDLDRRVQTTGHILEWLAYSVDERELTSPRMVKCVRYLVDVLSAERKKPWEIGPLGHALHSLAIYDERLFAEPEAAHETTTPEEVAGDAVVSLGAAEPKQAAEAATQAPTEAKVEAAPQPTPTPVEAPKEPPTPASEAEKTPAKPHGVANPLRDQSGSEPKAP